MTFEELAAIRAAGWTQGSFLARDAALPIEADGADGWLIASHPCDVVARSLDSEPSVDLIPVKKIDSVDGTYSFGGNPRKLHLSLEDSAIELVMVGRATIPRELLSRVKPSGKLAKKDARIFSRWLGSRYSRPFFPDEFNDRREPSARKVNGILKRLGSKISGIYVDMTDEELSSDEPYVVTLLFTVLRDVAADPRAWADANEAADEIVALWNGTRGIFVDNYFVESEDHVSLASLRTYERIDFDSVTIKGDATGDEPMAISV